MLLNNHRHMVWNSVMINFPWYLGKAEKPAKFNILKVVVTSYGHTAEEF